MAQPQTTECPAASQLARDGVMHGRFEDDEGLYTGMKDLFGFLVIERGSSQLWHRGRTHAVAPGDVVLLEPGEIYRDQHRDGPSTFEIVLFARAQVEAERVEHTTFPSPVLPGSDTRVAPLLSLRQRLVRGQSELQRSVAVTEALHALSRAGSAGAPPFSAERPAVARARTYLREHLSEQVRLDELAAHVRLDKYHLIRAFRSEVGVPPYEYLTQLRMMRARDLLRSGTSSTEVAFALGYCDQSQFHRHFVRIVGTTPGAFVARPPLTPVSR